MLLSFYIADKLFFFVHNTALIGAISQPPSIQLHLFSFGNTPQARRLNRENENAEYRRGRGYDLPIERSL